MWLKSLFLKVHRSEQSWIFKNKYLISIFFVIVKAIYNWHLEIELFKKPKRKKKKKIKIALSLGYSNSYLYNKRCNMLLQWLYLSFFWLYNVAACCHCQSHSSCLKTLSIRWTKRQGSSWIGLQISHSCNFYLFLWSSSDIFPFLRTALL